MGWGILGSHWFASSEAWSDCVAMGVRVCCSRNSFFQAQLLVLESNLAAGGL